MAATTDKPNFVGVPGIPMDALNAIADQNVKIVMQALVDGWQLRNGATGNGDNRFITRSEISDQVKRYVGLGGGAGRTLNTQDRPTLSQGQIDDIITQAQASVFTSRLYTDLGERVNTIDLNLVAEQNARIAAVQGVADDLAAEAATRLQFDTVQGSQISAIQQVNADQATQISGLITRTGAAESSIINLQKTTASQATSLSQLTTRVTNAESSITQLNMTTANQAQSLSTLTTRVNGAESNISTLQTTTANQANSLTSLTTRVSNAESNITNEAITRASADNAISSYFNTQISRVDSNVSAVQTQTNTLANNVASLSSQVTTLQSTTGSNTLAIQQEISARTNADNDIYGKYSVKIDNNGYVTGFGLISSSNNSTPFSEFVIRADRFAIASPSGPGVTPLSPFVVYTTPQTLPNGQVLPPGVYMDTTVVKQLYGAYIEGSYIKAATLEAGSILTGSKLIDRTNNRQIPFVAQSDFRTTDVPDGRTYYTHPGMCIYAGYWHDFVQFSQRARTYVPGFNMLPLGISVVVTGVVDSYLSLYYRRNVQTETGLQYGTWVPVEESSDSQNSYGAAALAANLNLQLTYYEYIEFAVRSTTLSGYIYNGGKPAIYYLNFSLRCTNI